jgi:signal peptidase I
MAEKQNNGLSKKNHLIWRWLKPVFELSFVGLALLIIFIAYGILPNRWYRTLYVYSGSMSPAIESGDVIIITPPPAVPIPGMIVTLHVDNFLVTHRVIDTLPDGKFITKGDANIEADEWGGAKVKLVGEYRARIPYMGYVLATVQDLLKVNSSGAWFVDRELLKLKADFGKQKLTATKTPTRVPCKTEALSPNKTPAPTSTPTQSLTIETSDIEDATPTPTHLPATPTSTSTFEPTVTELLAQPTEIPSEAEPKSTDKYDSTEPAAIEPTELPLQ